MALATERIGSAAAFSRQRVQVQITLNGKVAIISGAASGIGLATVIQFLHSGIKGLIAIDIAKNLPDFPGLHPDRSDDRLVYIRGDVRDEETWQRATQTALSDYERIDIVVNNAGVSIVKPIHEHSPVE